MFTMFATYFTYVCEALSCFVRRTDCFQTVIMKRSLSAAVVFRYAVILNLFICSDHDMHFRTALSPSLKSFRDHLAKYSDH